MKTIYKSFLITSFFALITQLGIAQCKVDECVSKLTGGYTFLKSYQAENTNEKAEYSYVFSKETNYMMSMCGKDGSAQDIIVTLFDSQNKQIATNFDKKSGKFYPAIVYSCKSTGIYYIKFTFNNNPDCFTGVLAFKK